MLWLNAGITRTCLSRTICFNLCCDVYGVLSLSLYSPSICKGVRVIDAVKDGNFRVLTHLLENELGNYINQQDAVSYIPIRILSK